MLQDQLADLRRENDNIHQEIKHDPHILKSNEKKIEEIQSAAVEQLKGVSRFRIA